MKVDTTQMLVTIAVAFTTGLFGSFVGNRLFRPADGGFPIAPPAEMTLSWGDQPADETACRDDAARFDCAETSSSEGGVIGCLLEFEEEVSVDCRRLMQPALKRLALCEKDAQRLCRA